MLRVDHDYGSIEVSGNRIKIIIPGRRRFLRRRLPDQIVSFQWSEITRVFAFKRDCYVVDSIHMLLELNTSQQVEIFEEMAGWQDFVTALPNYVPGAPAIQEWFTSVAFPPFETCWTQLYPEFPGPAAEPRS